MRVTLIILSTFLFSVICSAQKKDIIAKADQSLQVQDYKKSYELFEQCLEIDSTDTYCLEKLALSAYRFGNYKKAKTFYHKLEKLDTSNVTALRSLATIYELDENLPKAIKYNILMKERFPENAFYYKKLAALFYKARDLKEAFKYYDEAFRINNEDLSTIKGLAEIYLTKGESSRADSLLRLGMDIDDENYSLLMLYAKSMYKQKRYDSVCVYLEKVAGPIDLDHYHSKMLGFSYLQIDSVEMAIYYLRKSLVGDHNPEYAHYYLANAFEKKEDTESAIYHYNEAAKYGISPDEDLYHRNLARIYNDNNQWKKAIFHYKEAYRYEADPVLLFFLARASELYYKDKSIALRYYQRYLQSKADNAAYLQYAKERSGILKGVIHQAAVKTNN